MSGGGAASCLPINLVRLVRHRDQCALVRPFHGKSCNYYTLKIAIFLSIGWIGLIYTRPTIDVDSALPFSPPPPFLGDSSLFFVKSLRPLQSQRIFHIISPPTYRRKREGEKGKQKGRRWAFIKLKYFFNNLLGADRTQYILLAISTLPIKRRKI